MADERKIILEIREAGLGGGEAADQGENLDRPLTGKTPQKTASSIFANQVFSVAKSALLTSAEVSIGRYTSMTENYMLQNDLSNLKTVAGKMISIGGAAIAGAKIGIKAGSKSGNPAVTAIAGAAGAAIATAGVIGVNVITYNSKVSQFYSTLNATNMQTEWAQRRAGLWDGGRGTEN